MFALTDARRRLRDGNWQDLRRRWSGRGRVAARTVRDGAMSTLWYTIMALSECMNTCEGYARAWLRHLRGVGDYVVVQRVPGGRVCLHSPEEAFPGEGKASALDGALIAYYGRTIHASDGSCHTELQRLDSSATCPPPAAPASTATLLAATIRVLEHNQEWSAYPFRMRGGGGIVEGIRSYAVSGNKLFDRAFVECWLGLEHGVALTSTQTYEVRYIEPSKAQEVLIEEGGSALLTESACVVEQTAADAVVTTQPDEQ